MAIRTYLENLKIEDLNQRGAIAFLVAGCALLLINLQKKNKRTKLLDQVY